MRRRRIRAEHLWWLAILAWGALVVFWRPTPPSSYLEVPSADTTPSGFSIFHDMLDKQVSGVRRVLTGADMMARDIDVLLVLSPRGELSEGDREDMMDWVSSSGGTLVIGHPVKDEDGEPVTTFHGDGLWPISEWSDSGDGYGSDLQYIPFRVDPPREVPTFGNVMRGEITLGEFGAEAMLLGGEGEVAVSAETYGSGTVIQIADSGLLGNRSLGWKQSHVFAAALIDEVGRDKVWAFDESTEGIDTEPSLIVYLGSGRWRAVLLQVILLLIILYWWGSSRLGKPRFAPSAVDVREVTTLARDVGDFYFRANKSAWALSRSLEHFKLSLKGRGVAGKLREEALDIARRAQEELDGGMQNAEKHAFLVRKMAHCQQRLALERKGKKR